LYKTHVRPRHQRLDATHQNDISSISQNVEAVGQWRKQLCACVKAKGRHLEHLLKLKPALFRANTLHDRLFSEPPTVYRGKHVVSRCFLHKRGLCRHAVSVCLSVTFVYHMKTNKHIFKIFSPSCSQAILVFRAKRDGDIPTGTPLAMASNAGGVGKKRDSGRISGFAAYRSTVLSTVRVAKCEK